MPIRITGMNSGLDTEALISELVSAYRTKTQKYTKAQTKLSWKQDIWKNLNSKISSFYSKLSNLKYSAAYNIRTATISDSTKATVKASASAINGSYSVKIKKIAKSGYLTGANLGSKITEGSKLSELGYTGGDGTITVNANGKTTDIKVNGDTTVSDFVKSLNDAGVKASYDSTHNRIYVASSKTGKDSDFSLTGSDGNGAAALNKLGLSVKSSADTELYKNWAAYALNTNGTAYIIGYDADGKAITDGTYDAGATESRIEAILEEVRKAPSTITNNSAQIKYANSYSTVKDIEANNLSALNNDEKSDFHTLLNESTLKNVYIDADGNLYDKQSDGTYTTRGENKETFTQADLDAKGITLTEGEKRLEELEKKAGFTKQEEKENPDGTKVIETVIDVDKIASYKDALANVAAYEMEPANAAQVTAVQDAHQNGTLDTVVNDLQAGIDAANKTLSDHALLDNAAFTAQDVTAKITNSAGILDGSINVEYSAGATRVDGQDLVVEINGAEYTSSTSEITVNGLTINALAETGESELTVNVGNNTQGLYDKIKGIMKDYNELINEMTKLYNAGSSRGYEPLTSEEKDAMTDTEIKEWEEKIKGSLLRRDDTLGTLLSGMSSAMLKSYNINGQNYSLSSFGIHTLGILNAADNEQNAFHIDGDSEDTLTSGNADKLMEALTKDPDSVVEFMKRLTTGVYDVINKKMGSTSLSSFNKVYNDKEMAREYSDYTKTISKWEEKLQKMEDSYYKKFAAMESALATLQSQQSYLASLFG